MMRDKVKVLDLQDHLFHKVRLSVVGQGQGGRSTMGLMRQSEGAGSARSSISQGKIVCSGSGAGGQEYSGDD